MNLQLLFKEEICFIEELTPGYDGHASEVFLVKTKKEEVIVRTSRIENIHNNPFWEGGRISFGINPQKVHETFSVNNSLREIRNIQVPEIVENCYYLKEYCKVEKLEGKTIQSFMKLRHDVLVKLGRGLAEIHKKDRGYIGNPKGTFQIPTSNFHPHLIRCMEDLINRFHSDNEKIVSLLPSIIEMIKILPSPTNSTYILLDMDPSQFILDEDLGTIGLVDTEAYAIGPREFDLIALEYLLDECSAAPFLEGYCSILELPDLSSYRMPYRYFYRLLEVQGRVECEKWLNQPVLFNK